MREKLTTRSLKLFATVALAACLMSPALAVDSGGDGGGGGGGGDSGYSGGGGGSGSDSASGPSLADARALIRAQKWPAAVNMLKKIVAANPGSADANNLLGYSLRKSGDYKNAQGFYLKALKLNPRHKGAHEYLGELYVEIGQVAKAEKLLAKLEQICGNTRCDEYRELAEYIQAKS